MGFGDSFWGESIEFELVDVGGFTSRILSEILLADVLKVGLSNG